MGEEETAPGPTRRDAEGPRFSALRPSLRPESLEVLRSRGFERATPVQAAAIGLLAGNKDVAVEACTGSGKTLAFVLPLVEILSRAESRFRPHQVGAVVVSPPPKRLSSRVRGLHGVQHSRPGPRRRGRWAFKSAASYREG